MHQSILSFSLQLPLRIQNVTILYANIHMKRSWFGYYSVSDCHNASQKSILNQSCQLMILKCNLPSLFICIKCQKNSITFCRTALTKIHCIYMGYLWIQVLTPHYGRSSFTVSWLSGRNFSWSSHYSKSLSGYRMVFPAAGATMIDIFEHVDSGG